ncbi:SAP1 (YER047C) [Zygosaccharomyces parabailii]|nr:SAP1 (YER047C) [Zygosaccharomyces parabailii]
MDNTGSYYLLSKFSKLRKKPQQPLTDLTELYGRTANQSIYYLKLEEQKDYHGALQGWKALNTDVMYQLTTLEHEYPNIQSYSREETSLNTGVRELYHKSLGHLERLRKICENEPSNKPAKPYTAVPSKMKKKADAHSVSSSFVRKPPPHQVTHGYPTKMNTTLRDPKTQGKRGYVHNLGAGTHGPQHEVNFAPSKPLGKKIPSRTYYDDEDFFDDADDDDDENAVDATGHFRGFDDEKLVVDLTSDSDGRDDGAGSRSSDSLEFDVDDYYTFEREEPDEEIRKVDNRITNLSITSAPHLHARTVHDTIPVPSYRPPIPVKQPPIPSHQPPVPANQPPKLSSSPERTVHKTVSASARTNTSHSHAKSSKKSKSLPKATKLKATKSTPDLPLKHSNSPSSSFTNNKQRPAQNAAKQVLSRAYDRPNLVQKRTTHSAQQARIPKKPVAKKAAKPAAAPRRPATVAKPITKKPYSNSAHSASLYSTAASSASSFSSSPPTASQTASTSKATTAAEAKTASEDAEDEEEAEKKALKDALEEEIIESLHGVDKTAAKQIFTEIVVHGDEVHWDDIAGLEGAKGSLKEAVVYPFLRPDLFRGLREPVRGMLLFGPPGTGKTMLARAVATESHSTFFSISASTLTSKYLGESEKLVRALFAVAKKLSPSIIFVDEIDSIMGSRNNEGENESSRRIKNEFLVQWSSLSTAAAGKQGSEEEVDERVLVLAATNLPWSIDEAARRRFVRRQYIPLPEPETRSVQLRKLLSHQNHTLSDEDFLELLELTAGFSGSDITSLAKDAAMGPLRELGEQLLLTPRESIRSIALKDFRNSLQYIKPSVSQEGLERYEDWAGQFGSSGA